MYTGHKTNLSVYKVVEIIKSLFSDHSGIKVDTNDSKITGKSPNTWKLNNVHLRYSGVKEV